VGRKIRGKTDELVERLGESVSFDARLAHHDPRKYRACLMLGEQELSPRRTPGRSFVGCRP
jgi:hypothetical protein